MTGLRCAHGPCRNRHFLQAEKFFDTCSVIRGIHILIVMVPSTTALVISLQTDSGCCGRLSLLEGFVSSLRGPNTKAATPALFPWS